MKKLPFYRDTFFSRLILSYTALAVLLLGLAGGYLYTQANRMMVDEIARDSQNRLDTAKDYVERTLLRKYEDNLQNKAVSTVLIRDSSDLNVLLDNGWEGNLSRIASFRQDLDMFKQVLEGALNVTVYFRKGGYVVDSGNFYLRSEHSEDARFIQGLQTSDLNRWMVRTLPKGEKAMTYAVNLPYGTLGNSPKGYLFIDVDLEYLQHAVANILSSQSERLYIFDRGGRNIMQTASATEEELRLLEHSIRSGDEGTNIGENETGTIVLSHLSGIRSENGLTYAMIRPMDSFVLASKQLKAKIFAGCGLVLLFGLGISYLISRRFYIPMKRLIQHIRNLPGLHHAHTNEYKMIDSTLSFMGQKIMSLESQAQKNEMKHLVLGASLGVEHLEALPRNCRYQAAHIQLVEGRSEQFKEWLELARHDVPHELIVLNPQEAAIVFFLAEGTATNEASIAAEFARLKQEAVYGLRFGAGIGTAVQAIEEIPLSYRVAHQAYRYRFIYGPEAVVPHSRIAALDPKPHLFSLEVFQNALKAGDVAGADRFIDEVHAVLTERNLQLEAVELALLQLVSALYETVIELELQQLVPPFNLFDELKKDTLADTMASIRDLSERIGIHVRDSSNHAHEAVILKLKTYIDQHLHEELSLNVLSEVASLAPAYISTLFGKVMNESFTEYVTRTRLGKAAELLLQNEKMSVSDIASRVGYRNIQYFHTKFKARYGVTPVQYRQRKAAAGDEGKVPFEQPF